MITDRWKFTTKITLYGISSFHFYRLKQFKVIPWIVLSVQETFPNFLQRPTRVDNMAEERQITLTSLSRTLVGSQSPSTIESLSRDSRPHQMQEVNGLCAESRALRAEYCIVGIPHNTAI